MSKTVYLSGDGPADIACLKACASDTCLAVWSVQHQAVVEELQQRGTFAATPSRVDQGKLEPYRWMRGVMHERGLQIGDGFPVWVFLRSPPQKCSSMWNNLTPEHKLVGLRIQKSRMLISFHWPWANRILLLYPRAYITSNASERQQREHQNFLLPSEVEREASWRKIFNLDIIGEPGFGWCDNRSVSLTTSPDDLLRLQATVPYLMGDDLLEIKDCW
jgi:hypothetical protein